MSEEVEISKLIQLLSDEHESLDERFYSAILTNYRLGFQQRKLERRIFELENEIKNIQVQRVILKAIIQRLAIKKEDENPI